jgi:hypothetical protein
MLLRRQFAMMLKLSRANAEQISMRNGFVDCKAGELRFWCRCVITKEEKLEVGERWIFESEKASTGVAKRAIDFAAQATESPLGTISATSVSH